MSHKHRMFRLARLRRDESGVAAVEFAAFAPLLFLTALTAIDLGLAITERMTVDHILRAGADFAMADPGPEAIDSVIYSTAKNNFTHVTTTEPGGDNTKSDSSDTIYIPPVERFFTCSDDMNSKVADPATCTDDYYTYYRMRAEKTYQGIFMPDIAFTSSIDVQVR